MNPIPTGDFWSQFEVDRSMPGGAPGNLPAGTADPSMPYATNPTAPAAQPGFILDPNRAFDSHMFEGSGINPGGMYTTMPMYPTVPAGTPNPSVPIPSQPVPNQGGIWPYGGSGVTGPGQGNTFTNGVRDSQAAEHLNQAAGSQVQPGGMMSQGGPMNDPRWTNGTWGGSQGPTQSKGSLLGGMYGSLFGGSPTQSSGLFASTIGRSMGGQAVPMRLASGRTIQIPANQVDEAMRRGAMKV